MLQFFEQEARFPMLGGCSQAGSRTVCAAADFARRTTSAEHEAKR
ncbi:hypothetical protein [Nonomuraea aridisoli]|nr:hypothetical protein [Nonomuraea aridisoli]